MRYFITGTAGFVGFHIARRLLAEGHEVFGFDGMTPYYSLELKEARNAELSRFEAFRSTAAMLEDRAALDAALTQAAPEIVIHLAAQAGVRYSIEMPRAYVDSNVIGSFNLIEGTRAVGARHLLLASTSSVYGANPTVPFHETDKADEPLTIYAASKRSMELVAHTVSHLHRLPTTAFRFFTVYGPWGRPDMALFRFVHAIRNGLEVEIYGEGRMSRDFTYIDDLTEAVVRLAAVPPDEANRAGGGIDTLSRQGPFRIVNIGGGQPVGLLDFLDAIERAVGRPARRKLLPMQDGDVPRTFAAPDLLEALVGYKPRTAVEDGIGHFVRWYDEYHREDAAARRTERFA